MCAMHRRWPPYWACRATRFERSWRRREADAVAALVKARHRRQREVIRRVAVLRRVHRALLRRRLAVESADSAVSAAASRADRVGAEAGWDVAVRGPSPWAGRDRLGT